jgi:hypothetical protein
VTVVHEHFRRAGRKGRRHGRVDFAGEQALHSMAAQHVLGRRVIVLEERHARDAFFELRANQIPPSG